MEVVQVEEEQEDQAMEPSDHPPQDQDQDLDVVIGTTTAPTNDAAIGTNIVKGKRTKRQRPQSPIPFRMHVPPADEQQEGANASKSEEASSDICSNVQASEEEYRWGGSTEEEEEIATCLILLAQGQSLLESSSSPSPISPKQQHQPPPKEIKYTSRKFLETPHGSKAGYYVYECKTCFKTFPSFQALGGHRASHMRPKKDDGSESTRIITMTHHQYSLADDHENSYNNNHNNVATFRTNNNSLSLNLGNKVLVNNLYSNNIENELGSNNNTNNGKRQRVHRCSTCGAEFSSGQALGGHMRRHRGPVGGGAVGGALFGHGVVGYHDHQSVVVQQSMPALSFTRLAGNVSSTMEGENLSDVEACKLSLDLDLNLPAPPDQDDQSKLQIEPYKEKEDEERAEQQRPPTPLPPPPPLPLQQQEETPVLTPPPSLVDCHN